MIQFLSIEDVLESHAGQITNYGGASGVTEVADSLGRSAQSVCNTLRRIRRMLFDCINRTIAREDRS